MKNDIIDDRIDIISKGTMALTVTCARCHDHKFDPIPTKDYYALHGVFNSSVEPKEEQDPLLETPKETAAYREFRDEYASRQAAVKALRDDLNKRLRAETVGKAATYMMAVHEYHRGGSNDVSRAVFMQKLGLFPQLGVGWDDTLKNIERNKHNPVFAPWFAYEHLSDAEFVLKSKALATTFFENKDKTKPINPMIARLFANAPTSLAQVAARYASVFAEVDQHWQETMASYEAKKNRPQTRCPNPRPCPTPRRNRCVNRCSPTIIPCWQTNATSTTS